MSLIIPVIIFFLDTSPLIPADSIRGDYGEYNIYLVKQRWHTGLVFEREKIDTLIWPESADFRDKKWIDVGWGDRDFYQHPDFDIELAVKALFYPTPSTLRVEGFNLTIERYAEISDLAVKIILKKEQFDELCRYVHNTYFRSENDEIIIYSEQYLGNIKFYKANENYHLFNTCNTWVSEGLKLIGLDISTDIVLVEQLLNEATKFGDVIKGED